MGNYAKQIGADMSRFDHETVGRQPENRISLEYNDVALHRRQNPMQ